jgi:MIP family channel proteins
MAAVETSPQAGNAEVKEGKDECKTVVKEDEDKGRAAVCCANENGQDCLKPEYHLWRALLAEAIGTGMIVLFGCGSVCATLTGAYQGIWQVAIVWGFGVALAIYSTAEASGAHLNPAVTLAFWIVRPEAHDMTWKKSALYVVAQFAGAIICALINLGVYGSTIAAFERENDIVRGEPKSILTASAFGEYFPNPGLTKEWEGGPYDENDVSVFGALLTEAWGTCILAFVIFSVTNPRNNALGPGHCCGRPGVPFIIGATVSVLLALYAPLTQAGWNPARDFGPRIIAAFAGWGSVAIPGPRNGFWIYLVGPCIGAPMGAALADKILWYPK